VRVAFDALALIESKSRQLPTAWRRPMRVREWEAVAAGADAGALAALDLLPADERHSFARAAGAETVQARSAATVVRLSKFSTPNGVRGRAFYLDREPALTVKFRVGARADQLSREIAAIGRIRSGSQLRAPEILESDVQDGVSFLVEPVINGSHAHTRAEKFAVSLRMVPQLIGAHRDLGVGDEKIMFHADTIDRLVRLFDVHDGLRDKFAVDELASYAARLVADPAPVPVGWCHGDAGYSNIIEDGDGLLWLIDWEHGGRRPAVADVAKLAVMSPNQPDVIDSVVRHATPDDVGDRAGRRSLIDQMALMIVRELSWWEARRRRAVIANRMAAHERGIRRRLSMLSHLGQYQRR
jgi:aminoglycoside phosphotransferase